MIKYLEALILWNYNLWKFGQETEKTDWVFKSRRKDIPKVKFPNHERVPNYLGARTWVNEGSVMDKPIGDQVEINYVTTKYIPEM